MPEFGKSLFGAVLKQHRRAANLTQEGLAECAGISARSISDLERGLSRAPHPATVALLAQALSLTGDHYTTFLAAALPQQALPASPLELPPLPIILSPLIGREQEETALFHLLQRDFVRLLTLTGPAGVGKTHLALQVARTREKCFPDGVVFVSLAAIREPQLVMPTIAQTLGLQEKSQQNVLRALTTALCQRHLLLVLDNCEQVIEAAGQVLELLARCLQLKVLATSRARWRVRGEQVFPLAPLSVPDLTATYSPETLEHYGAIAMFLQRVRAIQPEIALPSSHLPVVAELCVRLDGLPLAIELAAARFPLFSPQQFLERLGDAAGPNVLQIVTGRLVDSPARHQSLRAAISWSYELLSEAEQRLFRRLCIFAGGVPLEAILAVCASAGEEESALLESLEALLAQSLAYRRAGDEWRFHLLETLREYGLEQLASAGEERALRAQHASYMLALAEREAQRLMGPEQARALTHLNNERENFRAALRWFQDQHELEQGLRLATALWPFWLFQGALSEGRDWLERLLAQGDQDKEVQALTRARAGYGAGVLAAEQGDYTRALELGEQCSGVAEQLGEQELQSQALTLRGNVAQYQGAFAKAARYFEAALSRAAQDKRREAILLNNLSILAQQRGDYGQARTLQEESLALKRSQGNQRGIAVALLNLGDIARDEGQLAEARARAEESRGLFEQLGDEKGLALALNNIGEVAFLQGDFERANACIEDSLKRSEQMGDRWARAVALYNTGRLAWVRSEKREAYQAYQQSLQLYMQEQSQLGIIECLEGMIVLCAAADAEWSACLYGLAVTWRDRTEIPLPPVDSPPLQQAVTSLQTTLGEECFVQAFSAGQTIAQKDALQSILSLCLLIADKFYE